jgi:cell division protein FtsB
MTWLAVLRLIGGWRAAAFLGLAVALGAFAGVQSLRLHSTQSTLTDVRAEGQEFRDRMVALTAKASTLAAQARVEYHEASARAEASYQAGRDSANQYQATVVADLRSGNIRLRNGWQACMSAAPIGQAASGTSSGPDGPANVQAEAFGRVLRIGADADNQVTYLQAELLATRQLAQSCGKTE